MVSPLYSAQTSIFFILYEDLIIGIRADSIRAFFYNADIVSHMCFSSINSNNLISDQYFKHASVIKVSSKNVCTYSLTLKIMRVMAILHTYSTNTSFTTSSNTSSSINLIILTISPSSSVQVLSVSVYSDFHPVLESSHCASSSSTSTADYSHDLTEVFDFLFESWVTLVDVTVISTRDLSCLKIGFVPGRFDAKEKGDLDVAVLGACSIASLEKLPITTISDFFPFAWRSDSCEIGNTRDEPPDDLRSPRSIDPIIQKRFSVFFLDIRLLDPDSNSSRMATVICSSIVL
jgi:hypothetical protein